ncbi:ArsR/SmtB family transcription factor [Isobaculum melis]|uniref:Rhodanese-related sulfurtransferase n=1 Tax=Isobaculum melis TaxID=142588 RepID=A0A1H9T3M5_9LACT|nr:metalloregulator ArsR/SmtB family transcription factor [Isobaculum melis]SER91731.1 Rhodanese-related sulfurtransferase [Isobaculum melis]
MKYTQTNKEIFAEYAKIGKAISNNNRLEILDNLMQSKKTVEALAKNTKLSVANVSKHLQVLLQAHLVCNKRDKNYIYYQIANEEVATFLTNFFNIGEKQLKEIQEVRNHFFEKTATNDAITLQEMEARLAKNEIILIDVRPFEEYCIAHIPGATSIPIEELEHYIKELPKNAEYVAYCRGPYCLMSAEAVEILHNNGLSAVRMAESVKDWEQQYH